MPRRLVPLLMVAAMVVGLAACKHPAGPYGWPTPDGWTWTTCPGWSVANPADRTICVNDYALRHDFEAAHELAHAWDHTLGTYPLRTWVEGEQIAWCVAELLTGHLSDEWIGGTYYSIRDEVQCPRAGQVWSDAQLMYMIIVG